MDHECDEIETAIGEWIEGSLGSGRRLQVETHVAACVHCRALADDLRQIRGTAQALGDPVPPAHVWPAVARQLQMERRVGHATTTPESVARTPGKWRASLIGLAAAAALVLGVGLAPWWSTEPAPPTSTASDTLPRERVDAAPPASASASSLLEMFEVELRAAEGHYDSAVAGLRDDPVQPAGGIDVDAEVTAVYREGLAVVDIAIAESQVALAESPDSEPARDSLFASMRRKLVLLRDGIALVNAMRKGDGQRAGQIVDTLQP